MFCAYGDIFTLGEVYCCDYGPKGHRGRAESPPALRCAAILLQERPLPGLDAPTTARAVGLPPRRGIVLSFGAKESTKESKRHGATEKRLLLPILTAGLAMSRAMESGSLPIRAERARARLFPPSKWAGLFPSAAYRRPAPAQLAGDILNPCRVGCFGVACVFFARQKAGGKSNPRWPFQRAMRPVAEWRPFLSNEQKTTSDPRAARLVAERR